MSAPATSAPAIRPGTAARIPELDGIRGLAMLLVVMMHYVSYTDSGSMRFIEPLQWCFNLGWSGVDLFFVLSGFLIGGILLDVRESPAYFRTFYLRRLFRIMPLYYLWMIVFVAMVVFHWPPLPRPLTLAHERLEVLPLYFLFLQNFIYVSHSVFGNFWLGALWSLGIEEQFYLVAPAVIRLFSRPTLTRVLIGTVVLGPAIRLIVYKYVFPHSHGGTYVLTPCRADALALGMLLAIGWRSEKFRSLISRYRGYLLLSFWILFAGVIVLNEFFFDRLAFVTAIAGYSWLAFFYASMLLIVLSNRKGVLAWIMRRNFLMELGALSYCIYIIHSAVNSYLHALLLGTNEAFVSSYPEIGVTLLSGVVCWVIAKLSQKYFEGPLLRQGHRYSYWPQQKLVEGRGVETIPSQSGSLV